MSDVIDIQVTVVPTEHALFIWPKVKDYIAAATVYTRGRYEADDVLDLILDGSHLLWIAFEDAQHVKGAVVTNIAEYPRSRWLACPFVTGEIGTFSNWGIPMLRVLQRFARDNGCEGLESTARLGWERIFKNEGYEAMWQTFQLPAE